MGKIAVLIPCFNEEMTIRQVVIDFKLQLPDAEVYVYDNNSTDRTADQAKDAGAIVRFERRQGKGNVISTMFREIEADIYILVDGDGTYPANKAEDLISPILSGDADMVIGSRLHPSAKSHFRLINRIGNRVFLFLTNSIFRVQITDLLSGYRAFSRDVVKHLPITSRGFEVDTEITIASLERNYRILEIPIDLSARPDGSMSKIRIWGDGFLIFNTILAFFRDYKPLTAFGILGLFFIILGLIPGIIVINEFIKTGFISRMPSAILAVGLVLTGLIICFTGLVIHTISRRFQELDRQLYKYYTKQ
jgi:glycosyltransferase involved in cell wall biosynthesis